MLVSSILFRGKSNKVASDAPGSLGRYVPVHRIASLVVEGVRGVHSDDVFTCKGKHIQNNNSAWKRVRKKVGQTQVRAHDLKHTFGQRLRAAGVDLETRKILPGHRNEDITTHYSAPELEELIEAANRVCDEKSGKTPALVILKQKAANA